MLAKLGKNLSAETAKKIASTHIVSFIIEATIFFKSTHTTLPRKAGGGIF